MEYWQQSRYQQWPSGGAMPRGPRTQSLGCWWGLEKREICEAGRRWRGGQWMQKVLLKNWDISCRWRRFPGPPHGCMAPSWLWYSGSNTESWAELSFKSQWVEIAGVTPCWLLQASYLPLPSHPGIITFISSYQPHPLRSYLTQFRSTYTLSYPSYKITSFRK